MDIDPKQLADQFRELRAKHPTKVPEDFDEEAECEHLTKLIHGNLKVPLADYGPPSASGAGGSGLVINAEFQPLGNVRAIKTPRIKARVSAASAENPFVDPEVHALAKLSHQNITRLYEAHPLTSGGFCMITEYVENPKSLDDYADEICCDKECRRNENAFLLSTRKLARIIYDISDALVFMHDSAGLIHFDIKPDNLLVSERGHPFITDLGFARDATKYSSGEDVEVGFTYKYSHPSLTDPDRGARISSDPRRSRNTIKAEQLLPAIDIFAFGKTLQEVLKRLELVHGDRINSNYVLDFLHIVACLCLDGQNSANGHHTQAQSFVSDRALGMPAALFAAHRFKTCSEIRIVLQRLIGLKRLEDELPEVDRWASATINVSDLGPTTLTPRVASLLNHPALSRLGVELQLGKLDTVFPTATHTRLQHSLGVYHNVREYIAALYYDPENPTFRTLFSAADGKKCLVSALVHDLGQTSFGHDLEEVDSEIFSHEKITERILASDYYKDSQGRTIGDLIEGTDFDCWGLPMNDILELIRGKSNVPVDGLLHDVINGQLDADKLDYLLRDSVECRVQYGHGIDTERFLRSLTTTARSDGRSAVLRLAIEQKGAASAEAFAFARYQLYQSVYWHHTFRVVKAMLLDGCTAVLDDLRKKHITSGLFFNNHILDAFLSHVIGFQPRVGNSTRVGSTEDGAPNDELWADIQERLNYPAEPANASKDSGDQTLVFFWKLATGKSRTIFEDMINRNYYKRVFEVSLNDLSDDNQLWLRDNLKGEKRTILRGRVEEALTKTLRSQIQSQMESRQSLVTDELLQEMESITAQKRAFAIDLPLRGWTASGDSPFFVSDYKRRHFRSSIGGSEGGHQENRLWSSYLPAMMKGKAFFRVYCEPRLHKVLTRVIGALDVTESLREDLPQLMPQATQ